MSDIHPKINLHVFFKKPASEKQALSSSIKINDDQKSIIDDMLDTKAGWLITPFLYSEDLASYHKRLLLSLALEQTNYDFLHILDVVFEYFKLMPFCPQNNNALLEKAPWFISLKRLHDLVHKNEISLSNESVVRAFLFYFKGLCEADLLEQPNSGLSLLLKKAIKHEIGKALVLLKPTIDYELEQQVDFHAELNTLRGKVAWRQFMTLPLDQEKGLLLYWLAGAYQKGNQLWYETEFCLKVLWEAAEYYSTQTGCASLVEDYENRQHMNP